MFESCRVHHINKVFIGFAGVPEIMKNPIGEPGPLTGGPPGFIERDDAMAVPRKDPLGIRIAEVTALPRYLQELPHFAHEWNTVRFAALGLIGVPHDYAALEVHLIPFEQRELPAADTCLVPAYE
jgi:hypothetical protein